MSSLNLNEKNSKKKKEPQTDSFRGIYGINQTGKYYFPSKRTSSCFNDFNDNGGISASGKNLKNERYNRDDRDWDVENFYSERESMKYDPFGMYTGRPMDASEDPVQDADDL